ncbi:hypothetical protein TNCV_4998801 [Trichonephila clavipes]|nr:hypothetical protein TNCV_4998801 [Trichonephila clavipes]
MERCAGSQWPSTTNNQEDRHVTCMALSDRAALSQVHSQKLGSFARQKVSAHTVRQGFPQYGLNSETMAVATLDAASPTRTSSMLLPWSVRSPDLSPIENVCSMAAEPLARHHTRVTTVDELWYCVESAWSSVPVHAM